MSLKLLLVGDTLNDAIGMIVVSPLRGVLRSAMDISSLASLGKIAGVGGIAIGAVVLLVRPLIDRAHKAKPEQIAFYRLIAIGAFAIGIIGLIMWGLGGAGGTHVDAGPCGVAAGRDASGNAVTCGTVPSLKAAS
jgi:quinol-cytochrome oxidoreductase complex cytochrome b subunit